MSDLIKLYEDKNWADLDWAWRHEATPDDRKDLLERIERDVGDAHDENGFSKRKRYKLPAELPDDLQYPAEVLYLGELAAACRVEPAMDQEIWDAECSSALAELEKLLEMAEVTDGDASLSRRDHAKNAIERLEAIERHTRFAIGELNKDEDAEWFAETVSALKLEAFYAGLNYQAAIGKQSEKYAVSGYKLHARKNVDQKKTNPETIKLIKFMKGLVDEGMSAREAAKTALDSGHGTSAEGNRKAWNRHKKKQKESERKKN